MFKINNFSIRIIQGNEKNTHVYLKSHKKSHVSNNDHELKSYTVDSKIFAAKNVCGLKRCKLSFTCDINVCSFNNILSIAWACVKWLRYFVCSQNIAEIHGAQAFLDLQY